MAEVTRDDYECHSQKQILFRIGKVVGKRWKIDEKLDEGGFGQVYKVLDLLNGNRLAALKVESAELEGGSAIKLEINVLEQCKQKAQLTHLPVLYHAKKHANYVYMVMELLGNNLRHIKTLYPEERMPEKDWSRIGLQCLHAVKEMHDQGFIHRDLKPSNFVFGHPSNLAKLRVVHVLDFGLARAYAFYKKGQWVARWSRRKIDFRGTFRYSSPNMHRFEDLGRRDDIYSLIYMLIEFAFSLPWQYDKDKQRIETLKLSFEKYPERLSKLLPIELSGVLPQLKELTFYSRPNYSMFYDGLLAVMKRNDVTMIDRYAFESKSSYKEWMKLGSKRCRCEDASTLMKSDPIRINGPPTTFNTGNITLANTVKK